MIYDILLVVLQVIGAIVAAAVLFLGFVYFIFLGHANAHGRPVLSGGFDKFAILVVYLSWFALLWWVGFSQLLLMVACGAAVVLSLIYAASYQMATLEQDAEES